MTSRTSRTSTTRRVLAAARRLTRGAAEDAGSGVDLATAEAREMVRRRLRARRQTRRVPLSDARVAVAASDHVRTGLAWEWDQTPLSPLTWHDALTDEHDLVVVEVSGDGIPSWAGEGSPAEGLADVLARAAELGVPTVAWVTGPLADGVDLSSCRHVFSTDELGPATQVRGHGDFRVASPEALGDVLIRSEHPVPGSTPAADSGSLPEVAEACERLARGGLIAHHWDLGGDDPAETIAPQAPLASSYRVLLDIGAREADRTRPVLDALAARTPVVTTTDRAAHLPPALHEGLLVSEEHRLVRSATIAARQHEFRDRMAHRGLRALVEEGHTYSDRARTLLDTIGRAPEPGPRTVSVVVPTNRPHELDNVLANVARQEHVDVELILAAHGMDLDAADLAARGRDLGLEHVTVVPVPADRTLGAVLNEGLERCSGAYVAKMDDDNFYGPRFLADLVDAFSYTSAGITGKWAHYVWLRSTGTVVLRFERYEHRYHRLVQGGSIVARADVAHDIRFSDIPRAVDSDFLNRAMAAGVQTYSGDRYNYISIRGDDRMSHTWKIEDLDFLAGSGRVVTYGDPRDLVTV